MESEGRYPKIQVARHLAEYAWRFSSEKPQRKWHAKFARRAGRLMHGTAAASLAAMLIIASSGVVTTTPTPYGKVDAQLKSAKKLYMADETPKFQLKLRSKATLLGDWLNMKAYAATEPQVSVSYQNRKVDVATLVTPDSDGYEIAVQPDGQMRPGSYTVTVSGDSDSGPFTETQKFAWGVLAVNTDKATYAPGETANIQMGVLDANGHTICDAPLRLSVTDPAGQAQQLGVSKSSVCKGDTYNPEPDYQASYVTAGVGRYSINLRLADSDYQTTSSFEVKAGLAYDITRGGATRLFPSSKYGMSYHVAVHQNFSGTVREMLPDSSFTITDSGGAKVIKRQNNITLEWQADWQAGQSYDVGFEYKPPPVSPAFYYLSPLKLINASGKTVFEEANGWQLAGDAAITLVGENYKYVDVSASSSTETGLNTTAGNTLVLLFYDNTALGDTRCLGSVTDSAGNTWVVPATDPSTNPPQDYTVNSNSVVAIAYVTNAAHITSVTVNICGGNSQTFAYDLVEFSGISSSNPVLFSAGGHNDAPSASNATVTTDSYNVNLCGTPTTDMLLRGGNFFCQTSSAMGIGLASSGANTWTVESPYTALTPLVPKNTGTVQASSAYHVITSSGNTSITWDMSVLGKAYSWVFMVFGGSSSSGWEQYMFWAQ